MSGTQVSSFAPANALFNLPQVYQAAQQYQSGQQTLGQNEIEMAARAAQGLLDPKLYPDEASRAAAWGPAVLQLRQQGFAKNADPNVYPGEARLRQIALMGTPSSTQAEWQSNIAGNRALLGSTAPAADTTATTPASVTGTGTDTSTTAAPPAPTGGSGVALGMRQNNPLNLSFAGQPGASANKDNRFAVFPDMATGVAATADQIARYQTQRGINTVSGAVDRWVSDPKADLASYKAAIATALGVGINDPIDLTNPEVQAKFILAAQPHESGGGGAVLSPADVQRGVQMAATQRGQAVQQRPAQTAAAPAPAAPGGVAARTGGVDVAGPGGASPSIPQPPPNTLAPANLPRRADGTIDTTKVPPGTKIGTLGLEVRPDGTLGTPTGGAQAQQAPAPAVAQPQAQPPAAAPPQPPRLQTLDADNLTAENRAQLRVMGERGTTKPAELQQRMQAMGQANLTRNEQAADNYRADLAAYQTQTEREYQRLRNAGADQRAIDQAALNAQAAKDAHEKAVREAAEAPTEAQRKAQTAALAQTQQQFQQENTLRDEFQKLTADFRVVQSSYENVNESARKPSGAGDMSLLYSYVRLLDPTSVVRESEFATAAASGSFGERVQGAVGRILSGERLPDSLRNDFVREAGNLYKTQLRSHNQTADTYTRLAESSGLDPKKVVTRFDRPQAPDKPVGTVTVVVP